MSDPLPEPLPALSPELRDLLDAEQVSAPPPPAAQGRVWTQVLAVLPALSMPPVTPATVAPLRHFLASKGTAVALAFGVGTGTGAVLRARLARVPRAVPVSIAAPPSPAPVPPPSPPAVPPVVEPAPPTPAPRPSGDSSLAAERRLVEQARSALQRGQPASALKALGEHARLYPKGRLAEERDALRAQALASAGRLDEARAAAARFHHLHPNSLLGPAVDASVHAP